MNDKITVMLVDDSSVIRSVITKILKTDNNVNIVSSVSDGQKAVAMARIQKPNIVILDVEMPVMDGLTALPKILEVSPKTKVIMCSSLTAKGADITIRAMTLGAVECIVKPTSSQGVGEGSDFHKNIISLVNALGSDAKHAINKSNINTNQKNKIAYGALGGKDFKLKAPSKNQVKPEILAIGSSTGGPNALFKVLKNINKLNVPIIITQHMPATFTTILAKHIEQHSGIQTFEAEDGMLVEAGKAYVAPGGRHMLFQGDKYQMRVKLDDGPQENFCKPSVEPMLRSAMEIYNDKILCVILTGMGKDGANEAQILSEKGGQIFAQDKETSVVWGMPGAVATAGVCEKVLPIDNIASAINYAFK